MAAARLMSAIIDRRVSMDGLTDDANGNPAYLALEQRDRDLVRAILMTALRHRNTIEALIARRLNRPLPDNANQLSHILHVACAQILFLDVPDSAAVNLAVTHAQRDPRSKRFAALVNAVLRKIAGNKERALPAAMAKTVDCPQWLFDRWVAAHGEEKALAIADMHRHKAPFDLTVKSNAEVWAEELGGIVLPTGTVRLARLPGPITEMEGFEAGEWWMQDAAASIPAHLFGNIEGKRVADLCAAPGGKTAQLVAAGAIVTAVDHSANRLKRLQQNLGRLGLDAEVVASDVMKYEPPDLFDAVLLDAPCSSTGTIRRHPDVAWTKTPEEVAKLADIQSRLLNRAVELTKPGGTIVFSNCSLDPLEGEELVARFCENNEIVALGPIKPQDHPRITQFITAEGYLRTTPADWPNDDPQMAGLDGFFAARLRKKPA